MPLATPEPPAPATATTAPPTDTPIPPTETAAPPLTATPAVKPSELSPEEAQAIIAERAGEAVLVLATKDFTQLAALAHPCLGVRFTPYGYVSEMDLVFGAGQIVGLATDSTKYMWGAYDGRGDPIELTYAEYHERFVYDRDYAAAPGITYNRTTVCGSNSLDTWAEFYPDGIMVEYHFPQSDPDAAFDWRALRLIPQPEGDLWSLSAACILNGRYSDG